MAEQEVVQLILTMEEAEVLKILATLGAHITGFSEVGGEPIHTLEIGRAIAETRMPAFRSLADKMDVLRDAYVASETYKELKAKDKKLSERDASQTGNS